jgi:hypothetical protein
MNDKLFINLKIRNNEHEEELFINVDHIVWFSKDAKVLRTSDNILHVLTEDGVKKLEDVLQPV